MTEDGSKTRMITLWNVDKEVAERKWTSDKGLKKWRAASGKEPTYECSNCHCKRYSPCMCTRKNG